MGIDFNKPTALYEQIEEDIRKKISSGHLKIGQKISSQNELSAQYNVSLITVKKALSNLIKEGILFSRIGKGTYVARKNRPLNLSKHKTIGLVLRDLKHPFFSLIVHAVEEEAYERGYNVLISNSSGKIEKEESQITHYENIGVDGLIIASLNLTYRPTKKIESLHRKKFPYIVVSYMQDKSIYYVGTDHEKGAFMAVEHLIKMGHKKIGYVNAEEGNLLGELRKKGYKKALNKYGLHADKRFSFRLETGKDRFQSGYELGLKFKHLKYKPEALFFYTDIVALGFQQGAIETGLKIPEDIAMIGFDDIDRAKYASSPLTTIKQKINKIGETAVTSVIDRIEGKEAQVRVIVEPELIVRESCGNKMFRKNKNSSARISRIQAV